MELPLHYDLDIFEEYYTDYLKGYEKDTLMQVVKTDRLIDYYSYFVSEKGGVITFKNEFDVYVDGKIETKKINDIVFIITSTVDKYLKERIENYVEINDDSLKEFITDITKHYEEELEYLTKHIESCENNGKFYELDLRLVDFFITHLRCFYGRYYLNKFSENSKNEIVKIFRFLKNEKVENNQTTQLSPVEIPDNDYSDTVPLERMIILEKLGIIKYIQSLQNDNLNEKHTAEILSSFTGIISGTIAKNLGVMGDKKNDDDKNSPYKNPKNLNLAHNKLDNFNIDLNKIIK